MGWGKGRVGRKGEEMGEKGTGGGGRGRVEKMDLECCIVF